MALLIGLAGCLSVLLITPRLGSAESQNTVEGKREKDGVTGLCFTVHDTAHKSGNLPCIANVDLYPTLSKIVITRVHILIVSSFISPSRRYVTHIEKPRQHWPSSRFFTLSQICVVVTFVLTPTPHLYPLPTAPTPVSIPPPHPICVLARNGKYPLPTLTYHHHHHHHQQHDIKPPT